MIADKKVLGLIVARGGSKRLRNKNTRMFVGRPLIEWTIQSALQSKIIDRLVLSSEDPDIIKVATKGGCEVPFVRPVLLSQDSSTTVDVALHTLEMIKGFDILVLLQPTSPLRTFEDIDQSIKLMVQKNASAAVSVVKFEKRVEWIFNINSASQLEPAGQVKRASNEPSYLLNGAVYIVDIDRFQSTKTFLPKDCVAYVMPPERSIDIDTETDWVLAESIAKDYRSVTAG